MRMMVMFAAWLLPAAAWAQQQAPAPPQPQALPTVPAPAAPVAVVAATPSPQLAARIDNLIAVLKGEVVYESYFHPGFRVQVSEAQFRGLNTQLSTAHGAPERIESVVARTPWEAVVRVRFGSAIATMIISIEAQPPHLVTGLRITGMSSALSTPQQVMDAVAALPGTTSVALMRLGGRRPAPRHIANADRAMAVGSAFKLVILAELVRATNAGERRWADLVTLDGATLPAGAWAQSPAGTRVSLRDLAARMIATSDNSGTDILMRVIGRERIEAMLRRIGVARDARNDPFLTTLEMFKLKGVAGGALAREYLALNDAGQRAMLAGRVAQTPASAIDPQLFRDGRPVMIDSLEWFISARDLVRIMDWLRRNTDGPGGLDARAILSMNPGLPSEVVREWRFIGFKGGSEPGVLNLTWLMQGRDGQWYALAATWNNTAAAVDQLRFSGLIGRLAELVAPPAPQPSPQPAR